MPCRRLTKRLPAPIYSSAGLSSITGLTGGMIGSSG